jgi:hypothetical protein
MASTVPMAATVMMLSGGGTRCHGEGADNKGRDCEKSHEFRHG